MVERFAFAFGPRKALSSCSMRRINVNRNLYILPCCEAGAACFLFFPLKALLKASRPAHDELRHLNDVGIGQPSSNGHIGFVERALRGILPFMTTFGA